MTSFMLVTSIILGAATSLTPVTGWNFLEEGNHEGWAPNQFMTDVRIEDGTLSAYANGHDAFFLNRSVSFSASPFYYVQIRIRSDKGGMGKLYWSEALEGQYGGLTEAQTVQFDLAGTGAWEEIPLFPYWHTVNTIRQLRLNIPYGAQFEIDAIEVYDLREVTGEGEAGKISWDSSDIAAWWQSPDGRLLMAPPFPTDSEEPGWNERFGNLDADTLAWATIQIQSENEGLAAIVWGSMHSHGLKREFFPVRAGETTKTYVVELAGLTGWETPVIALGVLLPGEGQAQLESVHLGAVPTGPAQLEVTYFGFENMPNRIGMDSSILLRIENHGGSAAGIEHIEFIAPDGLEVVSAPDSSSVSPVKYGEFIDLLWTVRADDNKTHDADLTGNQQIELTDLLQLVSLYNAGNFHCIQHAHYTTYHPGSGNTTCRPHHSDYNPTDWQINMAELLRLVQFYNAGAYHARLETEDGFAPGVASEKEDSNGNLVFDVEVRFTGEDSPAPVTTSLTFTPSLNLPVADYVPEPQPIETELDIAAYYFPGWDTIAKWRPIHLTTPIRKPVLGYYDESNPEVVDWQIKWAVENGISIFLVDWYWVDGSRHLEHWFDAYRQARYRDHLEVAIMWANHNPPGTHSYEDWVRVTEHWIEHYFSLDTYYHIDGMPAVFIWDPRGIRNDLGSSAAVRAAFGESQRLAQEAGYAGIYYAALFGHESSDLVAMLEAEGYSGTTTYHEWGDVTGPQTQFRRADFEDVVQTAPKHWLEKLQRSMPLEYFPVATTGWDSRPWHGAQSLVIAGRTPERFERLLRKVRTFCTDHQRELLVIGPMNEWGEGSYIEPATEYGFEMYEAIRDVFGAGNPDTWPVNVAPVDVGLGPYDLPPLIPRTHWDFNDGTQGWTPMMGIGEFRHENQSLRFRSMTHDPAFTIDVVPLPADEYGFMEVHMRVVGNNPGVGQLFWSSNGRAIAESTSVRFTLASDGLTHTYRINLSEHPRWRGQITGLRFDPCTISNIDVTIEEFRLIPTGEE